jgi:hypothetical protein
MKKIALILFLSVSNLTIADTLLHVGNLIDTDSGDITKAVTIRVIGNEISEVTKGYANPKKMIR